MVSIIMFWASLHPTCSPRLRYDGVRLSTLFLRCPTLVMLASILLADHSIVSLDRSILKIIKAIFYPKNMMKYGLYLHDVPIYKLRRKIMNYSFWEKDFRERPTDFTIIGSGIVGLSTALSIKEKFPSATIKILERGYMPYGASTKNAGFACFGSVSELLDDFEYIGEEATLDIVKMRWKGLAKLRQRVGDIPMKYNGQGGTEVFRTADVALQDRCLSSIDKLNTTMRDHLNLVDTYSHVGQNTFDTLSTTSIYNRYEGSINPMYMMDRLTYMTMASGISIYYGVQVESIDRTAKTLVCNGLDIPYHTLIVCTNGFTSYLMPDLDVVPARNQVLITKPLQGLTWDSCYHLDRGYVYFRAYEGRILLGGGRNIDVYGENTDAFGYSEQIRNYLHEILAELRPGAEDKVDHYWSGILGIGPSKFPICERLTDEIIVAVRMGGMGVAIGSHLGELVSEMI
jgi:gamma-glutamylputrescine oxidase